MQFGGKFLFCQLLLLLLFGANFGHSQISTFLNFANSKPEQNGSRILFYIHDWNTPQSAQNGIFVKNSLFHVRNDLKLVVVVDWSTFSQSPDFYALAQYSVPRLAQEVYDEIEETIDTEGVEASNVECVGHGVGAHVCGQIGKKWNDAHAQNKLGKIVGLNPTGPYFKTHASEQLSATDATFVEVWHTDRRIGIYSDIGTTDVYPKSGKEIEYCNEINPLKRHFCLHNAAVPVFIENFQNLTALGNETAQQERISMSILTLDVSPSMQNFGRIQNMLGASKRFINSLPTDYFLGIVIFGGEAHVAVGPTNISDLDFSRQRLTSNLPTTETQIANTSIGGGIFKALEVIDSSLGKGCPDIILVTDGEENRAPLLSDVKPHVTNTCTRIHTIALGDEADQGLEAISDLTRGQTYFASDVNSLDKLTQSLVAASTSQFAPKTKPILFPPKPLVVDIPVSFVFDDDVGKDTTFSISTEYPSEVEAELTSPDGIKYSAGNYTVDTDLHQLLFKLLEVQAGNWTIQLNSKGQRPLDKMRRRRQISEIDSAERPKATGTVFVTTHSKSDDQEPIRLDATLSGRILNYEALPLIIEASVYKGNDAITGADVEAYILGSDGVKTVVKLLDNGAGADVGKHDGIYSRFITSEFLPGKRFEVEVHAKSNNSTMLRSGSGDPFKVNEIDMITVPYTFERYASAGSFRVSAESQYIPLRPNPIRDLVVTDVVSDMRRISLSWTAAGKEGDNGTADEIELKMLIGQSNFSEGTVLGQDQVVDGSLVPLESGSNQLVTLEIPLELWEMAQNSTFDVYFSVRSYSTEGGWSQASNLASVTSALNRTEEYTDATQILTIVLPIIILLLILAGIATWLFLRTKKGIFKIRHSLSHRKMKTES